MLQTPPTGYVCSIPSIKAGASRSPNTSLTVDTTPTQNQPQVKACCVLGWGWGCMAGGSIGFYDLAESEHVPSQIDTKKVRADSTAEPPALRLNNEVNHRSP